MKAPLLFVKFTRDIAMMSTGGALVYACQGNIPDAITACMFAAGAFVIEAIIEPTKSK